MLAENADKIPLKASWSLNFFSVSFSAEIGNKPALRLHNSKCSSFAQYTANLSFKISDICLKLLLTF